MVDTTTGEVEFTRTVEGRATSYGMSGGLSRGGFSGGLGKYEKTPTGKAVPRLGDSNEYAYIRTLMPAGAREEDGFVYLSDPFIRRLMGPTVKLTEQPSNQLVMFMGWTGCDSVSSDNTTCTVAMSKARSVAAQFAP